MTGRFWAGRFKSRRLLDEQAALACCVYVDLNVIRAVAAETPEESNFTSAQQRILERRSAKQRSGGPASDVAAAPLENLPQLIPVDRREGSDGLFGFDADQYLRLVDATSRALRGDKKGAIPEELAPILQRLEIEPQRWVKAMRREPLKLHGSVLGRATNAAIEAGRRGARWLVRALELEPPRPSSHPVPS